MADDRFYVKTLRMQNFRCFEDVTLGPFDPHFNLLVGENGAGKSSVLVALAAQYRNMVAGYPVRLDSILSHRDIKRNIEPLETLPGALLIESDFVDAVGAGTSSIRATGDSSDDEHYRPLQFEESYGIRSGNESGNLIISYDVRRLFGEGQYRHEYDVDTFADIHPAFEGWLDPGVDSSSLRSWIKDQTLRALQVADRAIKKKKKPTDELRVLQLDLVKGAVVSIIDNAVSLDFDSDKQDIALLYRDESVQFFREMSAGERAFIGLFADIARRACLLNAQRLGGQALDKTPGLVLIDEIDLHLHPKWQRQIVPALKKIFPKIQFFATTHSPQVIGEARPEEIVLLTKDGQQKRPSGSYGRDSNWILECVMEAEGRDPAIAARLKTLFQLIEDDNFVEAREAIKSLRRDIGDGPETVGAEAYLWRMEHLGEEAAE